MPAPDIRWGPNARPADVSQYSLNVLAELLARSGNDSCVITATVRSPEDDARVVFANLELPADPNHIPPLPDGVTRARALYLAPMQHVIDVYVAAKKAGHTPDEIRAAMTAEILHQGPYNCSHHCASDEELAKPADQRELNVFDVSPRELHNAAGFIVECRKEAPPPQGLNPSGLLAKLLEPPHDPGIHLEIRQPGVGAA